MPVPGQIKDCEICGKEYDQIKVYDAGKVKGWNCKRVCSVKCEKILEKK